ncbi:MAG TPA: hypothetical protein VFW02_01905 [Candidatus Limnocylindrales bacterium]|nr:hypothetical protein [Candidatus Limnocylindrales bacterium]
MRVIGRLLALLGVGVLLSAACGAVAARAAKRRIVPLETPDADEIRIAAIFEPLSFRSTATSFRGGTIDCWYGGGVIDLRGATLHPAGAHLQVKAVFGGGQILVPESWRVTARVLGIGGLGDARPKVERPEDAPHLTIEGTAIFGGFGVMSEISDAEVRELDKAVARSAERAHRTPETAPSPEMASIV